MLDAKQCSSDTCDKLDYLWSVSEIAAKRTNSCSWYKIEPREDLLNETEPREERVAIKKLDQNTGYRSPSYVGCFSETRERKTGVADKIYEE